MDIFSTSSRVNRSHLWLSNGQSFILLLDKINTLIGARYSPAFFNKFFCVHTQAIFADDEPSEHANSFPDIRWRLM